MIVWPKQPTDYSYDKNGFQDNHQALIIKELTFDNTKEGERVSKWRKILH